MKRQLKYSFSMHNIIHMILGLLFVISGFIEGVNSVVVSYWSSEYILLFHLKFLEEWTLGVTALFTTKISIELITISSFFWVLIILFIVGKYFKTKRKECEARGD